MLSYFQTALPRSTSQAHTPAQWRLLIFFLMPVCCFTHSSLPPPSLTLFLSHLPLWFKSLLDKFSHFCLSSVIYFPPDWLRQVWAPVRTSVTLVSSRYTWWQSAEMKPIERSSTSLLNPRHFCFARPSSLCCRAPFLSFAHTRKVRHFFSTTAL